jgi:hypothetical protein
VLIDGVHCSRYTHTFGAYGGRAPLRLTLEYSALRPKETEAFLEVLVLPIPAPSVLSFVFSLNIGNTTTRHSNMHPPLLTHTRREPSKVITEMCAMNNDNGDLCHTSSPTPFHNTTEPRRPPPVSRRRPIQDSRSGAIHICGRGAC